MRSVLKGVAVAASFVFLAGQAGAACLAEAPRSGKVLSVSGEVLRSGRQGYVPLEVGQRVSSGMEIIVGRNSSATLLFGGRKVALPANTTYRVEGLKGGGLCLASGGGAASAGTGVFASGIAIPVLAGGAAIIGIGVAIASSSDSASN